MLVNCRTWRLGRFALSALESLGDARSGLGFKSLVKVSKGQASFRAGATKAKTTILLGLGARSRAFKGFVVRV